MARRDGYSRGLESLEEIRASDRFIEQLRVSGTYEPSTRADAALAAALLTWRDEARMDPLNPPPSADEVDIDSYAQPRRSEEHTSELQSRGHLVCRLLLEKKKKKKKKKTKKKKKKKKEKKK